MVIQYTTAKKLKEFLGESAPRPIVNLYWPRIKGAKQPSRNHFVGCCPSCDKHDKEIGMLPAYQLHDLLSKPFCDAIQRKRYGSAFAKFTVEEMYKRLCAENYDGGMEAVEKCLLSLMDGK